MTKLLFLIFFCITSSQLSAKIKLAKTPHSLNEIAKSRKLKTSKKEQKIAAATISFYKSLRHNNLNLHQLKKIKRLTGKSSTFKEFRKWYERLDKISKQKSYRGSMNICKNLERKAPKYSVEKLLNNRLITQCHKRTLSLIYNDLEENNDINETISTYLYNHFTYLITSKNANNLYSLLDKLSKNEALHKKVSNLFIKQIIDLNLDVSNSLLSKIYIDPELTAYIQQKGLKSKQTNKLFYSELKSISSALKNKINDNSRIKDKELLSIVNFIETNRKYLSVKNSIERVLYIGRALSRNNYDEQARTLFEYVINNSTGEDKNEAIFQSLWTYVNNKEYTAAHRFIISHDLLTNFELHGARLKFWTSFAIMKSKDKSSAINYFNKLITAHPLTYYAIMATKSIQTIKDNNVNDESFYLEKVDKSPNGVIISMKDLTSYGRRKLKRLKLWGNEDYKPFIQAEYRGISNSKISNIVRKTSNFDKEYFKSNISLLSSAILGSVNNYVSSFKILYKEVNKENVQLSRTLLSQLFPKPYLGKIRKVASEGVDPIILLSLIRQESAFNPEAESHVGATGLMQLMPSTAKTIRKKVKRIQLQNPTINLQVGSKYFEYLYTKYDGNLVYTLSAYNAGESRVKRWKKKYFRTDSIMHNIENIPFNETRNYVKYIFRNIFFYKLMHDKLKMVDSSRVNEIFDIALKGFKR